MPRNPKTVRAVAMQKACRICTIKIDVILVGDHAELCEIEIRVQALQWIERPRHHLDTLSENAYPLLVLQLISDVVRAVLALYREHVRMMYGNAAFMPDEAIREANHFIGIKCAKQYAAGSYGRRKMIDRYNVKVGNAPDLFLKLFDQPHFVDVLNVADRYRRVCSSVHS